MTIQGRNLEAQLTTAKMLIAQFIIQIEEHEQQGLHTDRIAQLRAGIEKWENRATELQEQLEND